MNALTLAEMSANELQVMTLIMGMGGLIVLISVLLQAVRGMHRTREVEKSRRELAAYVAEGSISPGDAERLMKVEPPQPKCGR